MTMNPVQTEVSPERRGATAVEMAIVAPIVMLLLMAIVDLGLAVYSHICLAEAARAGARFAAVHGAGATSPVGPTPNDAKVEQVVRSYAAGIEPSKLTVNSTWIHGNNAPGSRVCVATSYKYKLITSFIFGGGTLDLCASQSMNIVN
jgi:Flp pilus assembly protein TadG